MSKQVMYAFFGESSPDASKNHRGDQTYLGTKSDGLNREYFGSNLDDCKKMVDAARKRSADYRLEEITYEKSMFGEGSTSTSRVLAVWPMSPSARTRSG